MKSFAKKITKPCLVLVFLAASGHVSAQMGLRAEVHKPLTAAQEALNNNHIELALRLAAEAAAVPALTPMEQQFVWRLQALASVRGQQWGIAVDRLEALLAVSDLPATDRLALQEMLVNASIQKKDPARAVRVARQYLQSGGPNPSVRTALLQSLSFLGEHQQLLQDMEGFARQDVAQNRKTPESELRLMGAAHLHLKDEYGYFLVLKRLLESYPSKAYWADAIVRLINLPGFNNRYELDGYRLLAETENLEEATDYTEMAELALKAGLPAEALRVLENGHQKGVLGKGTDAPMHAHLLTEARKKTKEDESLLPQLEQNAEDGNAWMAVAAAHASKQNWGAAVSAYDKAITKGGLRREAEAGLHRGIALLKNGQKPAALDQWAALQQDSSAMQLASLWMLLSR